MNAPDKSERDRYARRVPLADALVRATNLDGSAPSAIEAAMTEHSEVARGRLVPREATRPRLSYGLMKGELFVPDSFIDP